MSLLHIGGGLEGEGRGGYKSRGALQGGRTIKLESFHDWIHANVWTQAALPAGMSLWERGKVGRGTSGSERSRHLWHAAAGVDGVSKCVQGRRSSRSALPERIIRGHCRHPPLALDARQHTKTILLLIVINSCRVNKDETWLPRCRDLEIWRWVRLRCRPTTDPLRETMSWLREGWGPPAQRRIDGRRSRVNGAAPSITMETRSKGLDPESISRLLRIAIW
ncbi:hypothetical protein QBC47DRAFT_63371 [Echria macrotheca]|uniref:Uncharacterized protein n=1 Tax=Echria macrotheca TaxID=438768 RepID=A0AAJ0B889_9PEZI|nr:hypothetical protein QBC47DRAFT_63371 [Echria macrotheca]